MLIGRPKRRSASILSSSADISASNGVMPQPPVAFPADKKQAVAVTDLIDAKQKVIRTGFSHPPANPPPPCEDLPDDEVWRLLPTVEEFRQTILEEVKRQEIEGTEPKPIYDISSIKDPVSRERSQKLHDYIVKTNMGSPADEILARFDKLDYDDQVGYIYVIHKASEAMIRAMGSELRDGPSIVTIGTFVDKHTFNGCRCWRHQQETR